MEVFAEALGFVMSLGGARYYSAVAENFCNPVKRNSHVGGGSPVWIECDYFSKLESA